MERFYTPEQIAKDLQLHHLTILKLIKDGKLKSIRLGRVYRIKESDLDQFLTESYYKE